MTNNILFWGLVASICILVLSLIVHQWSASENTRFQCVVTVTISLIVMISIMVFSPRPPSTTQPLVHVDSLSPGYYDLNEVWQIGKRKCALIRTVTITEIDKVRRQVVHVHSPGSKWLLCDVTDRNIVGSFNPRPERPFTGYVIVEKRGRHNSIRMYNPLAE